MARYPRAAWRPLPEHGAEARNFARLFIVHIIVGSLNGAEAWFRREDVKSESHFGLGEGHEDDPVRQWLDTDEEADTNWDANGISITVETAGTPDEPFTDFQIAELIGMGIWAARTHALPAQLADGPRGSGFGWHSMYPEWNRNSHTCPGAIRIQQLKEIVFPAIFRELEKPVVRDYAQVVVGGNDVDLLEAIVVAKAHNWALCRSVGPGKIVGVWPHKDEEARGGWGLIVGSAQDDLSPSDFPNGGVVVAGRDRWATGRKLGDLLREHPPGSISRTGKPWR